MKASNIRSISHYLQGLNPSGLGLDFLSALLLLNKMSCVGYNSLYLSLPYTAHFSPAHSHLAAAPAVPAQRLWPIVTSGAASAERQLRWITLLRHAGIFLSVDFHQRANVL